MSNPFSRTELLIGKEGIQKLNAAHIAIFGVGGVGGYTAEALARCGIGTLDLIDNDKISVSNINRQIYALESTIGRPKTDVAKERITDINPKATVNTHEIFFTPQTEMDFSTYDYVVDAIDTVAGKLEIITRAKAAKIPVISSMGAGNKLNPTMFEVTDISKTSVCPLAKVMRQELKKRKIENVKVVYSKELPIKPNWQDEDNKRLPGSISFVPSVVGLIIASEVVKDIINNQE